MEGNFEFLMDLLCKLYVFFVDNTFPLILQAYQSSVEKIMMLQCKLIAILFFNEPVIILYSLCPYLIVAVGVRVTSLTRFV